MDKNKEPIKQELCNCPHRVTCGCVAACDAPVEDMFYNSPYEFQCGECRHHEIHIINIEGAD